MKKLLALLAICSCSMIATAQTAAQIVEKAIATAGGTANAEKIKTLKITGTIEVGGMSFPITQQLISGRGVKTDVEVMGSYVRMAYLDGKGWHVNPFEGVPEPTAMNESQLQEQQEQTSPVSTLFDAVKRGDKTELAGQESAGAEQVWKLKTTTAAGVTSTWFINSGYEIIKVITPRNTGDQVQDIETTFADYRETGGVRFPHLISNFAGGKAYQVVTVEKYEINVPVDEKIFVIPG